MQAQETAQNAEINDTMQDMDINTDENAAGTSYLNEPVGEENAMEKLLEVI